MSVPADKPAVAGVRVAGVAGVAGVVPLRRNRDFQLLWSGQAVSLLGSQTSRPNDGASSAEVGVITGCMWIWAILLILLVLVRDPLWLCPVVLVIGFAGPG